MGDTFGGNRTIFNEGRRFRRELVQSAWDCQKSNSAATDTAVLGTYEEGEVRGFSRVVGGLDEEFGFPYRGSSAAPGVVVAVTVVAAAYVLGGVGLAESGRFSPVR